MPTQLTASQRITYNAVLQHPVARNLAWLDIVSMLDALAGVEQWEHEGTLKIIRNGQMIVLHRPTRNRLNDVRELMNLRRFLERSAVPQIKLARADSRLLVVLDQRMARIYKVQFRDALPELVIPYDRAGAGRHLHYLEEDSRGRHRSEPTSFFEAIAQTLQDADQILLFGCAASMVEQLVSALLRQHPALAQLVAGIVPLHGLRLNEHQLLAHARAFYEKLDDGRFVPVPTLDPLNASAAGLEMRPRLSKPAVNATNAPSSEMP